MPSVLVEDSVRAVFRGEEPWPQTITLFRPLEVEQTLLPDSANCLAVEAFLKMCKLDFQMDPRRNAEYMSPTGRVPFIQCGAYLVAEFDNIVCFVGTKGTSLSRDLSPIGKSDMRAYISLVNNVFLNAELYICWVDQEILEKVTKVRHGSIYPWPLNHYLNWQKRREVIKRLKVLGWYNKTIDEICDEVKRCCSALSSRLERSNYFSGTEPMEIDALVYGHLSTLLNCTSMPAVQKIQKKIHEFPLLLEHVSRMNALVNEKPAPSEDFEIIDTPNELDALVFGHIFTIITTNFEDNRLANIVKEFDTLINHCKRIETTYFCRAED